MDLKKAISCTYQLMKETNDEVFKKALKYCLHSNFDKALELYSFKCNELEKMSKFFLIEIISNNLTCNFKNENILESYPMLLRNDSEHDLVRIADAYNNKALEPCTALEKYICSFFGFEWECRILDEKLNYFLNILDFSSENYEDINDLLLI